MYKYKMPIIYYRCHLLLYKNKRILITTHYKLFIWKKTQFVYLLFYSI